MIKDLYPKYTKNIYNTIIIRPTTPVLKWAKDLKRSITNEDIQVTKSQKMFIFTPYKENEN